MTTTPKTPLKHAATILAWSNDAAIQYRKDETAQWADASYPLWHEDYEYRVKPAASVYPETKMAPDQITDLWRSAKQNPWDQAVILFANQIIRRAIDDGQVVRAGAPVSTPSGCWREDFGELSIVGPRLLVEQAVKQLEQVNSPAEIAANKAFDRRLDLAQQALMDAGYVRVDAEGTWRKDDVVDAEFDPDFQEVKTKKEPDELARMACRALCEYLGKSRDDVSFEVIQAIILLERNKP